MDDSFDSSLEFTLAEEGGYTDHPTDLRFVSNHGISLSRLRRFMRDPGLGTDDVRHIPCTTVRRRCICGGFLGTRTRCDAMPASAT